MTDTSKIILWLRKHHSDKIESILHDDSYMAEEYICLEYVATIIDEVIDIEADAFSKIYMEMEDNQ